MKSSEITPEATYLNRRAFLKASIWAGATLTTVGAYRAFSPRPAARNDGTVLAAIADGAAPPLGADEPPNRFEEIAGYNNYYEFSTDKAEGAEFHHPAVVGGGRRLGAAAENVRSR